jgi:hypothetical protein
LLHTKQLTNTKIRKKNKHERDEDDNGNDNNKMNKLSIYPGSKSYTPLSMWVPLPHARVTYPFPPSTKDWGLISVDYPYEYLAIFLATS